MFGQQEIKKQCTKCGEIKSLDDYSKGGECRDGYINRCKMCMKIWAQENRKKNIEIRKAKSRKWYYDNKLKALAHNREWKKKNRDSERKIAKKSYEKNKEKIKERGKIYRENNREEIRRKNKISTKKWREKNKEKMAALTKAWREKNKERNRHLINRWFKNNKEKRIAFTKNSNAKRRALRGVGKIKAEEWNKIKEKSKGRCHYCKKKKYLTQDHVIPLSKGGLHHISNIVPACQSCNGSKGNKVLTLL